MSDWLIVSLAGISVGGIVGAIVAGIRVKAGWQRGNGPIARHLDHVRRTRFNDQLPDALATMSNALRAGFSITQAFESVVEQGEAPMSEEFAILQQQLKVGMSFESALESLSDRVGSDELTLVTTAILVSRKTGGNVTEIFDKISETIRARQKIQRKIRSLTAQGRLQGIIVTAMPLLLGAAITVIRPGLMLPFLSSSLGVLTVVVMLLLLVGGWLLIRKIIKIDV